MRERLLLKRRTSYSIHKVKLNKVAKLQRDKKAKEKALLKECSLPDKVTDVHVAAIKAAVKKGKRKRYHLIHKETINHKARLRRAKNKEVCCSKDCSTYSQKTPIQKNRKVIYEKSCFEKN